jgi:hypothetical protein
MIGGKGHTQLPFPHPGQMAVRRQARRFNWLSAGRRWRKTTLVMAIAVEQAAAGRRIIWGAPTYDQVRIGWDETRRACGNAVRFNQERMAGTFPTGGTILYRSLDDPDNARGHTADGVVIDEVADVQPRAWHEVLRPMLIDTGGWMWGIGTPKGRNWFFQEYVAAMDDKESACWQVPTLGCEIVDDVLVRKPHPLENPDIPFSEIVRLFETEPRRTFQQEILAQFLEADNSVFRNIAACITSSIPERAAHVGHRLVMGVDWGKHNDYTALSVGCADCKVELARDRFNQIDYAIQRARLGVLAESWAVTNILAESNAMGEPIIEQLQRDGLPVRGFVTSATSKPPLIENLALVFERAEWQFQADPVWTSELEAYERKVTATTGRSTYSAPEGVHDDTVMARALMCWEASQRGWLIW